MHILLIILMVDPIDRTQYRAHNHFIVLINRKLIVNVLLISSISTCLDVPNIRQKLP